MAELLIATRNKGKLKELQHMLNPLELAIRSIADFPDLPEIAETGNTFEENAVLKAQTIADLTGMVTMADDSGLEVDALGGKPGVYSARFAGENATNSQNNELLLNMMSDVPAQLRGARFVSVIAVARPGKLLGTVRGFCEGIITDRMRGNGGFGYDPLFFLKDYNMTFAELSLELKNKVSHRAKALNKAVILLEKIILENAACFDPKDLRKRQTELKEDT
ncbi:MAG: XTP/dITP diphosphatase [Candidatus Auribacter fodinae]|uniref:dITP/XTP pyrophosphatase n=1 Tax=Candidatus Auribacter fodinae TaxID=2093366 RepID=A0A3A4QZU3_9BACT|nr:MAG: XTP/dITP diphosphatase [Candidatus Auribacter fodinae]